MNINYYNISATVKLEYTDNSKYFFDWKILGDHFTVTEGSGFDDILREALEDSEMFPKEEGVYFIFVVGRLSIWYEDGEFQSEVLELAEHWSKYEW